MEHEKFKLETAEVLRENYDVDNSVNSAESKDPQHTFQILTK